MTVVVGDNLSELALLCDSCGTRPFKRTCYVFTVVVGDHLSEIATFLTVVLGDHLKNSLLCDRCGR